MMGAMIPTGLECEAATDPDWKESRTLTRYHYSASPLLASEATEPVRLVFPLALR